MSDSLDGATISGALQNKEEMRRWMRAVNRNVLLYRNMLDAVPLNGIADDPSTSLTVLAPPPPVDFTVIGTDGQFQISITLPQDAQPLSVTLLQQSVLDNGNPLAAPMVHQLQSATTTLFDAASGVTTYGPFSELTQTFQLPNQTLFWRIRSSFDGNNWNEWQLYGSVPTASPWFPGTNYVVGAAVVPTDPNGHTYRCIVAGTSGTTQPAFPTSSGATVADGSATWQEIGLAASCGPIAVASGFARSTSVAPRSPTNNSNNATVNSVDAGNGTDTIQVFGAGGLGSSWIIYDGQGGQTVVSGGSILGAAQSAFYNVEWARDTGLAAFPNASQYVNSLQDKYFFVALIQTVASGGGGGQSGGGGTSDGGGGSSGGGGRVPDLG